MEKHGLGLTYIHSGPFLFLSLTSSASGFCHPSVRAEMLCSINGGCKGCLPTDRYTLLSTMLAMITACRDKDSRLLH